MINQDLVKQFQHIKAGTLSGVLRLEYESNAIRFYFEEGSLLLLDFGQDKEIVMAGHFVELYKIDDAMAAYSKSQYTEKQIPIVETLLKQQLVHQNEVDQVTRYMVEDILCRVFGHTHSTTWQNAQDVDIASFDINKSTVKIRIDIDMLLKMVQSRIQEREHVQARIENWDVVYSIQEDAPADEQLNEMERNVLSFVDGRQSVKDIARGVRESNVNIGIYICSLETQGFIRKGGIKKSTRTVAQPAAPVAASPVAASPATVTSVGAEVNVDSTAFDETDKESEEKDNFEVYTGSHVRSQKKSAARPVVMAVILIAVISVAGLVWSNMQDQKRQEEQRDELRNLISSSSWKEAELV
ncbi:MAG: hypothetical protein HRU15_03370, partial [Planctomycetes bacterium]|nr:hypothetical protein [Planctomycetota bacterium]